MPQLVIQHYCYYYCMVVAGYSVLPHNSETRTYLKTEYSHQSFARFTSVEEIVVWRRRNYNTKAPENYVLYSFEHKTHAETPYTEILCSYKYL